MDEICDLSRYKNKRVLVTGGAGFVGSELVRQLYRVGAKVTVLDNFSVGSIENIEGLNIEIIHGDIRYSELVRAAMRKSEVVFHLVACPFIPSCYAYPSEFMDINVNGTLNVLLAAIDTKPECLVYPSTGEVYGPAKYLPIDEEHPLNPVSTYAVSKLAAERLCYTFYKEHEVPVVILRLFNSYGPRETHPYIIPEIISQLTRTNALSLGDTSVSRDFTYVEDTVRAFLLAGQKPELAGEVMNIGSGKNTKVRELIYMIAELLGKRDIQVFSDPQKFRPAEVPHLRTDATKARNLLNWVPKVPLKEGLAKTIKWYLKDANSQWIWEKKCYPMVVRCVKSSEKLLGYSVLHKRLRKTEFYAKEKSLKYSVGDMKPPVTVIIPTRNEKEGIKYVLSNMPKEIATEIIVVDSSSDETPKIAKEFGATVIREDRRGYGRALQTGIENANGEIIVYIDADGTYDPKEIPKLVKPVLDGKFDVAIGSRLKGNMHPNSMPTLNRFGNLILSFVLRILFQQKISDSQCGLRAIRKKFLENLACNEHGMPYVTEQLIKLAKKGAIIGEIPISYRPRIGQTKLVPWKDGFRILRTMLKNLGSAY